MNRFVDKTKLFGGRQHKLFSIPMKWLHSRLLVLVNQAGFEIWW